MRVWVRSVECEPAQRFNERRIVCGVGMVTLRVADKLGTMSLRLTLNSIFQEPIDSLFDPWRKPHFCLMHTILTLQITDWDSLDLLDRVALCV